MKYIINLLFLAIIASSGALVFNSDVNAQQRGCTIMIGVETIPESSTEFPYTVTGAEEREFTLSPFALPYDGLVLIPFGDTVTVTQGDVNGWVLRDISCGGGLNGMAENEAEAPFIENGVSYSIVDSGVTLTCNEPSFLGCTFINSRTEAIPTLSEWGLIAMVSVLGIAGFVILRRRQVSA